MLSSQPTIRPLYAWEIQSAQRVFGNRIAYSCVRIHECVAWPDTIKQIGLRLQGAPPSKEHNAITLGNHIFFPIRLPAHPLQPGDPDQVLFAWLIHELTHVWQYQSMGWRYLVKALYLQFRHGAHAYDYGGETGLLARLEKGWKFEDFNLEQQGDITRAYYQRLVQQKDLHAWTPYLDRFQDKA